MSDIAIRVESLGKMYRIYDRPVDRLKQMLWGRYLNNGYGREFWALQGVTLEIERGETVGIIGRNGSGKSTFLQMLAAGLAPTTGCTQVHGRIAALLELGSGFNPDFTGRENVFLNAAVLGVQRDFVESRLDDILLFAEIGSFIDQPVRMYSSGMVVRLAFAIAIHIDADILIIDEALAVGDEAFCRKCYGKIRSFQENGGTILFVTHSAATVVELCQRAILLDHGELLGVGLPKLVIGWYQKIGNAAPERLEDLKSQIRKTDLSGDQDISPDLTSSNTTSAIRPPFQSRVNRAYFDPELKSSATLFFDKRGVEIIDPHICTEGGERVNYLVYDDNYFYVYRVRFESLARRVRFGMLFKTVSGYELAGATSEQFSSENQDYSAGDHLEIRFRWRCLLNPGAYFANAGVLSLTNDEEIYLARVLDVIAFKVQLDPGLTTTGSVGLVNTSEVVRL